MLGFRERVILTSLVHHVMGRYRAADVLVLLACADMSCLYRLVGKLADWDARWNIISGSVDCRTQAESGEPVTDESVYHEGMGCVYSCFSDQRGDASVCDSFGM